MRGLRAEVGEVDAAFASAFLVLMGILIWPSWYGLWGAGLVRSLMIPVVCGLAVGRSDWRWRFRFSVWAIWIASWIAGDRSWEFDESIVIPLDHGLFAVMLALLVLNNALAWWGVSPPTPSE